MDTRNKRASLIGLGGPFNRLRPAPDGSLTSAEDRRHLLALYAAVLTPVVVSVVGPAYQIFYRTDAQVPFWTGDGGLLWTDDAAPFWVPRGAWVPWPGELTGLTHQQYEFRLTVKQGLAQRKVTALTANLDLPDVEEQLLNVAIGAGGTRLSLTKSYQAIKVVFPTLLADGGTARSVLIADKDHLTGPLVEAYDENGLTTAHADVQVQGY